MLLEITSATQFITNVIRQSYSGISEFQLDILYENLIHSLIVCYEGYWNNFQPNEFKKYRKIVIESKIDQKIELACLKSGFTRSFFKDVFYPGITIYINPGETFYKRNKKIFHLFHYTLGPIPWTPKLEMHNLISNHNIQSNIDMNFRMNTGLLNQSLMYYSDTNSNIEKLAHYIF